MSYVSLSHKMSFHNLIVYHQIRVWETTLFHTSSFIHLARHFEQQSKTMRHTRGTQGSILYQPYSSKYLKMDRVGRHSSFCKLSWPKSWVSMWNWSISSLYYPHHNYWQPLAESDPSHILHHTRQQQS